MGKHSKSVKDNGRLETVVINITMKEKKALKKIAKAKGFEFRGKGAAGAMLRKYALDLIKRAERATATAT